MNNQKLNSAIELLDQSIREVKRTPENKVLSAALAKTYEVAFEYIWKAFKRKADEAGLEVYSPRDAIKAAAQLKLIYDLELWEKFLNLRNLSVHDYLGVGDHKEFFEAVQEFYKELKRIIAVKKE